MQHMGDNILSQITSIENGNKRDCHINKITSESKDLNTLKSTMEMVRKLNKSIFKEMEVERLTIGKR